MSRPTLISPYGYDASTCGYCSPSGSRSARATSKKYAFEGSHMSVKFYQDIIDRGWRRSGDFVYHPDMANTCCPQYTIRLDARSFKPNKKHRQVINRWNRYLSTGSRESDESAQRGKGKGKGRARDGEVNDWTCDLHQQDASMVSHTHGIKFETTLTPAIATEETFELYNRYQIAVHKDKPDKMTMRGFRRFLCDSPLIEETIKYKHHQTEEGSGMGILPEKYGSYHLLFRVDSKLIGISVIDILPSCVSSVYFIWDPDWAWASLGKLSALFEASLAKRIHEAGGCEGYLYMGYWIANCQKMRYKSEYSPSFLLDPGTNIFHPLTPELDRYLQAHPSGYRPFSSLPLSHSGKSKGSPKPAPQRSSPQAGGSGQDSDSDDDAHDILSFPSPAPPGFTTPESVGSEVIKRTLVLWGGLSKGRLVPFHDLQFRDPESAERSLRELHAALGSDLVAVAGKGLAGVKDKGILVFG